MNIQSHHDDGASPTGKSHKSPSLPRISSQNGLPVYRPLTERIHERIARNEKFFSLEFFPPRTAQGLANFYHR